MTISEPPPASLGVAGIGAPPHPSLPSATFRRVPPPAIDRSLPLLVQESPAARHLALLLALWFTAFFALVVFTFWAPADAGVDQNAYLVGGRLIAQHFTPRYDLPNPFAYVGAMFIRTPAGVYYPKYPIGLPLLYALVFWIFGPAKAVTLAFAISPVSATLAILGMFFLARLFAGSFAALLAAILLASSQIMLLLADNPNSHAACLAFVVWGMFFLIRWWQTGSVWRGALAGFFLGYACLIRYSEGLLILPIAVATLHRLRWTHWRSWLRNAVPALAWALPVVSLLIFNKLTLGTWTGYDSTNESEFGSAFTWAKLSTTWEQMVRTLYDTGLFFTFPLGIAGLFMLFRRHWQLATMMLAWFLPGVALYTAYYFSPDMGLAYARFFLTFLPAALVGVAVCFNDGILAAGSGGGVGGAERRTPASLAMTVGIITAIGASVGLYRSTLGMENGRNDAQGLPQEFLDRQNLAVTGQVLAQHIPAHSTVFAGQVRGAMGPQSAINYIQFMGDWNLFTTSAFSLNRRFGFGGGPMMNPDNAAAPTPRQREQVEYENSIYLNKSARDLLAEETKVINTALNTGQHVFVVSTPADVENFQDNLRPRTQYTFTTLARWDDLTEPVEEIPQTGFGFGARRPPNGGGFGGGGPGGRRGPGGFFGFGGGGGGGGGGPNGPGETATNWQLVEIKLAGNF